VGINSCVYETAEPDTFVVDLRSFNYELGLGDLWNRQRNLTWVAPALNPNQSPSAQLERLDVEELTTFLAERGARRVLLDVRHNGGGNVPTALLSRLSSEPFRILSRELRYGAGLRGDPDRLSEVYPPGSKHMLNRIATHYSDEPAAQASPRFPFFCQTAACELAEAHYAPHPEALDLDLAVLTDHGCISSCDQLVAIIKDNGLGPVVGRPSAGGHSPYRVKESFELHGGQTFQIVLTVGVGFRPNGEPLEGNPPQVDHFLAPLSESPDSVHERALRALGWTP